MNPAVVHVAGVALDRPVFLATLLVHPGLLEDPERARAFEQELPQQMTMSLEVAADRPVNPAKVQTAIVRPEQVRRYAEQNPGLLSSLWTDEDPALRLTTAVGWLDQDETAWRVWARYLGAALLTVHPHPAAWHAWWQQHAELDPDDRWAHSREVYFQAWDFQESSPNRITRPLLHPAAADLLLPFDQLRTIL